MRLVVSGLWKLSAEPAEITVSAADEDEARRFAEASGIMVTSMRPAGAHGAVSVRRPHPILSPGTPLPGSGVR